MSATTGPVAMLFDFDGTLGIDRDAPVGFRAIRLTFELESDASDDDLQALLTATERYCVVFQTLANPPELSLLSRSPTG